MTKIYNKHTKKTHNNVEWAPKGKFWYVKGASQRYYPANGWAKTTGTTKKSKSSSKKKYTKKRKTYKKKY